MYRYFPSLWHHNPYCSRHHIIFNRLLQNFAYVLGTPSVTCAHSFGTTVLPHVENDWVMQNFWSTPVKYLILSFYFVLDGFPSWCGRNWVIFYIICIPVNYLFYLLNIFLLIAQTLKIFLPNSGFISRIFQNNIEISKNVKSNLGNLTKLPNNLRDGVEKFRRVPVKKNIESLEYTIVIFRIC